MSRTQGPDIPESRGRLRRSQALAWRLLLLCAASPAVSDVLLFRLGDFAIAAPHLLLAAATGMVLWRSRRLEHRPVFAFAAIVVAEVLHALAASFASAEDWWKSFAQFLAYGVCFLVLTKLRPDREVLEGTAPWAAKLGLAAGGLGVLQFLLFRMNVPTRLPDTWSVRGPVPEYLSGRYGEWSPAVGLAEEPSYYALGLAALLAYLFFLKRSRLMGRDKLYLPAVAVLLTGICLSLSLAGLAISAVLLLQQAFSSRRVAGALLTLAAVAGLALMPRSGMGLIDPLKSRIHRVAQGMDSSAVVRVAASTRLLFAEAGTLETTVLGTGLGMEDRERQTYLAVYSRALQKEFRRENVKIHNILTVIRYLQGWLGLTLYGVLLLSVIRPAPGNRKAFFPVLLFFILSHFASGQFLSPEFWSLFALVALLSRIPPPPAVERPVQVTRRITA